MAIKIIDIEGIGEAYASKLIDAGINTVDDLLEAGATRKGRGDLADETGIDESRILTWVNMADLFRIKGVATQFAELLVMAGVDTVKELRNRNAENLHAKLVEVNDEKGYTRVVPSAETIADYIEQAKDLDPVITH